MYHIMDDKRSQLSAQLILTGFKSLLLTEDFELITVTAICREAGVSRSTFYRLFDNTQDVLDYACFCLSKPTLDKLSSGLFTKVKDFAISFMQDCRRENKFLQRVLLTQGGKPFLRIFQQYKRELYKPLLLNQEVLKTKTEDFDFLIDLFLTIFLLATGCFATDKEGGEELSYQKLEDALKDLAWIT